MWTVPGVAVLACPVELVAFAFLAFSFFAFALAFALAFAFVALALAHLPRPVGDGALELLLGLLLLDKLGSLVLGSCVSPVFLASMSLVVMPPSPHNGAVLITPPEHNMPLVLSA